MPILEFIWRRPATSRPVSHHSLSGEERLRRYVAAVERGDWKLAQRLALSSPRSGGDRADPAFIRRVDGLRRLTYRVLLVVLSATSWAPARGPAGREVQPWSCSERRTRETGARSSLHDDWKRHVGKPGCR